ncbi:helicase C-terminal domain-containing protein [Simiduia agarivorans]|uniref:DinG family ATP-dependent helicase n=1 Tax=Simiduia agarivorans (strain DSM 21679 / JCM 13881 / BCRC 17597 / SA1) TaxID=1117647 RepID=K4KM00_SIMAS|nr:helicase C-terminal domain-containing protein [Simiduia agarivorans]AFV00180.1 DinG family ATP-dependent helicase [Simiduia agarivorans SA1 = DSM 21679]
MPVNAVSVGELCRFVARQGDLDLRFTPAPLAEEGRELHQWVAEQRTAEWGDDFSAEVSLSIEHAGITLRGRADGWLPTLPQVEEVKSFRGKLNKMPENRRSLHWAQVQCYGWMLCEREQLETIRLALVYVDADQHSEQILVEYWTRADLAARCTAWCQAYADWLARLTTHREARLAAAAQLAFPYNAMHAGQRTLAENVYIASQRGQSLLAEAPTGTGKTLACLFPALKASARYDKCFFLTAKTPGRALALEGLRQLALEPLVVVELIARTKACEYPGQACHGEECPLAQGFFDRLPAARAAAFERQWLDAAALRQVAAEFSICPYYLSQEMCRWADVVVADYNYYFDAGGLLHALVQENGWRALLLIDEAHNLADRARAMYSCALTRKDNRAVRKLLPTALHKSLKAVDRQWTQLVKPLAEGERKRLAALPEKFLAALQQFVHACNQWQADSGRSLPEPVLEFYFSVVQLCKLAEMPAEQLAQDYIVDVTKIARGEAALHLRNGLPGRWLAPRFEVAHAAVIFSATLSPMEFPRRLLGLPEDTALLKVPSPFCAEQLSVTVHRKLSTRFAHRAASLPALVAVIGEQCLAAPGNYLAFFSSFDYLQQVERLLSARYPMLRLNSQTRHMREQDRQAFVAGFDAGSQCLGLAVLGGAFSEGIDLPGNRLVGAFVATLGLPQFNPVNEEMRQLMDRQFGNGYAYTYLYPGLQKVVQAAGRVIRKTTDNGCVHLLDDRFADAEVRQLLPDWWQIELG